MNKHYFSYTLQSLLLLLLQVVVMNNIRLFGYLIPIIYLYPLIFLPYQTPRWLTTLLGTLVGLLMDMAMNTPGLNMASATLVGYLRNPFLFAFTEEQAIEDLSAPIRPSIYTMKRGKYLLFILLMVLTHVGTLLLLEAFSSTLFLQMLPHILGSTLITCVVFAIFEAFSKRNRPA